MKKTKKPSVRKATRLKSKTAASRKASQKKSKAITSSAARKPSTPRRTLKLRRASASASGKPRVAIPTILFEGDSPGTDTIFKRKDAEAAVAPEGKVEVTSAVLPEAYGTQQLKLTPRDPHWIHAHWDFTREQMRAANAQSADGHLVLRLSKGSTKGPVVSETPVHRESVRWFVHAPEPGVPYAAELGYYGDSRHWSSLATSKPVQTPAARPSADRRFELATVGPTGEVERHATMKQLRLPPVSLPEENLFAANAHSSLDLENLSSLALSKELVAGPDFLLSSHGVSSWASASQPSSFALQPAVSPGFWCEVNAELIVYGATESDATVKVGDRTIPLQTDGSFRFRFSLPDGDHGLEIEAISAKTGERRAVRLNFQRTTTISGEVTSAPQDPGLKPPSAKNL